jgi:uncharacterized protein YndB with AHSA1/START domain
VAAGSHELTLELTRTVAAARATVFAALVDPGEFVKWFGPMDFTARSVEFDARPGGGFRIEMQPADGDPFYLGGDFREIDPPVHLAYTFRYEDPDPDDVETLVSLSLEDLGGSTAVVLEQGPFKTEARRELHRAGWTDSFDKLKRLVSARA